MDDFGLLVGKYLSSLPTLTDEQKSELILDSSGRLVISGRYLEDAAHSSGDAGLHILAVRNDTLASLVDTDGDYAPFQVDASGALYVAVNSISLDSEYAEDTAHTTGDVGQFILAVRNDTDSSLADTDGDYAPLQVDENGRLKVVADIEVANGHEKLEDSAHSSGDVGSYVLAVRADTRPTDANTSADGDYASLFVNANGELYIKDTDVLAQLVTIDAVLDTIKTDTGNIATEIADLSHDEDAAHSSGDAGIMSLAVRNDTEGSLADTDGDYAPLQVDSSGRLRTLATVDIEGTEAYTVTDALAAAGDGLETITASGTPWVTVASLAVGAGTTAHIYGWQFACDQNCQARIVTDDTVDTIVYKTDVNSSAQPGKSEHWSKEGRIEIAGAANLEVRVQIKKRSATGGNGNGTGSLHIRTV